MLRGVSREATGPIVLFGDFNEITSLHEKTGVVNRSEWEMDAFRRCLDDYALLDLGYRGCTFTLRRGRHQELIIRETLERFVPTTEWKNLFSCV